MSNTIVKISARAKAIRKAHPGKKWQDCIKQASREIKAGSTAKKSGKKKVGAASKGKYRQTGTSKTAIDNKIKAKAPGKRISETGKVYYERRKNRSDKPGSLNGVTAATLKKALRDRLEDRLGKEFVRKTVATTKRAKTKIQKSITSIKAELRRLK